MLFTVSLVVRAHARLLVLSGADEATKDLRPHAALCRARVEGSGTARHLAAE